MYKIFCDGACSGNPGKGAWAFVVLDEKDSVVFQGAGYDANTTNNRMELMAAIQALSGFDDCAVFLDSKYVKDGISSWILKWKVNGWKSASGAVKNQDLWMKLDDLVQDRNVIWHWVKGHSGSLHDFADELARESIL